MNHATPIVLVGNLTADPELRFTATGTAVCRLQVAVNHRTFDKVTNAWKDGEPAFYDVDVWRQLAENVAESLRKGQRVLVSGGIAQRRYEDKQGQKRVAWTVTADAVGAELSYATAAVKRTPRADAAPDDPWASASSSRPADQAAPLTTDEAPF